jgi:hypothetical protein
MSVKPGWKTTEFWLTVAFQMLPLMVIFGALSQDEVESLSVAITEAVKAITALIIAAAPLWKYIEGRTALKFGG